MQKGTLSFDRCSEKPKQKYSPRLGELKLPVDDRQSAIQHRPMGNRVLFNLAFGNAGIALPYPPKLRFVTRAKGTSATIL